MKRIPGIHHVTGIAGDPQGNIDFYSGILGLRLIKVTVNFDDPGTYHFYYGDEIGGPGTVLTFFPWPNARKGRPGTGQATTVAFSIPSQSLGYWTQRLREHGISVQGPVTRFDDQILAFSDSDGLQLELVGQSASAGQRGWRHRQVPPEHAIQGFHSVTLSLTGFEATDRLLVESLGFRRIGQEGSRFRYEAGEGEPGALLDLLVLPDAAPGQVAVGTIHHVAWRAADNKEQLAWRDDLTRAGYDVTPVRDRQYFHSIYFREPGGVLFEIATDGPGFTLDEAPAELGTALKLPPWLEPQRARLEQQLPHLKLPELTRVR